MSVENFRAVPVDEEGAGSGTIPPTGEGDRINLGAFRKLVVPEEKIDPYDLGEDLDFSQDALAVVRRPEKQRWFAILDHYWLETRLLEVASPTSQYGIDWYYVVDKAAKSALRSYIKDCVVLPCYLFEAKV